MIPRLPTERIRKSGSVATHVLVHIPALGPDRVLAQDLLPTAHLLLSAEFAADRIPDPSLHSAAALGLLRSLRRSPD